MLAMLEHVPHVGVQMDRYLNAMTNFGAGGAIWDYNAIYNRDPTTPK